MAALTAPHPSNRQPAALLTGDGSSWSGPRGPRPGPPPWPFLASLAVYRRVPQRRFAEQRGGGRLQAPLSLPPSAASGADAPSRPWHLLKLAARLPIARY